MADAGAGFAQLDALLRSYDLAELVPWARQQFINGSTPDQIALGLRSQEPFRQKYKVIFDREAKGLPPVTVSQVLEYRQRAAEVEHLYGMPAGFVNTDQLMLKDVSISELSNRVQTASEYVDQRPDVVDQLQSIYGMNRGAAIAYALDPDTGLPAVTRQFQSAQVASQSIRQGFGQLSRSEAEGLQGLGVTEAQAASGFGQLVNAGELTKTLEGETPTVSRQDELDVVSGSAAAQQKIRSRQQERQAVFAEGGGFTRTKDGFTGLGIADT